MRAGWCCGTSLQWGRSSAVHELGVVFHMVDLLEDIGRERGLTRVGKVVVELGEVSGVVTDLFSEAWLWASDKRDLLRGAELEIHQIEAVTRCDACGCVYPTVRHGRTCPQCGSAETALVQGNELSIREIEAE